MRRVTGRTLMAKHIMHTRMVTIDPEMTVQDVMQVFLDRQITGAPVIDDEGRVIGVVSHTDLIRYQRRSAPTSPSSYFTGSDGASLVGPLQLERRGATQVQDIMTPAAFMAEEDTPVEAVARFMLRRRVHRVIITRRGKLAGIITSMDLLRALLRKLE